MTSKRGTIQTKMAGVGLKLAQKFDGATITYSHQGGTGASLAARIGAPMVNPTDKNGLTVEGEMRPFSIPRQTNFSGAVSEGDEITWESRVYVVQHWQPDKWDAVFEVFAVYTAIRRAAV